MDIIGTLDHGQYFISTYCPEVKIRFGNNVSMRNFGSIYVNDHAQLIIGDNVFFNNYCSISCVSHIEIGNDVLIGEGVRFYDNNHIYSRGYVAKENFHVAPIKIGDGCWIGANVVILKGVTIGEHSIIGAGCVIHKDVPPHSIVKNKQDLLISSIE